MLRLLLLLLLVPAARAHGGEDHGAGAPGAATGATVTASVLSRRFEVVLKHAPVRAGQPYRATLYLADFATNQPVRGATIRLEEPGVPGRPFTARPTEAPGVYVVERREGFARDGRFALAVRITSSGVNDLLLLQNVYIGPAETAAPPAPATAPDPAGEALPGVWILAVLGLGAAFAAWLVVLARRRRASPPAPSPPHV